MEHPSAVGTIAFLASAYALGIVAAIPVGGSQLEIVRRALHGKLLSGVLISVGSTAADLVYGCIVFFGILRVLERPLVDAIFWLVNSVVLAGLGWWAIRKSKSGAAMERKTEVVDKKGMALLTGFTLGATNPVMMSWWLVGVRILKEIGTLPDYSAATMVRFLIAAALGLISYSVLVAYVAHKLQKSFSERMIRNITLTFGILLFCLAGYFAVHSTLALLKLRTGG